MLSEVEERRSLSALEFSLRKHATCKAQQIILWQTSAWRRRAKIRNCVLGDENTSFFHAAANCHHRKNQIKMLLKDGVEFFADQDKLSIATEFFTNIFGTTSGSLPTVDVTQLYDQVDLGNLEEPFSWGEIVSVIDKLPNNRSPGPDGFTKEFFKAFKHTMKDDLLHFLHDFYDHKIDLQGINTAILVLLPKKESPTNIKDFRPISLVHSVPKLTTKALAVRLQKIIPTLVHPLQSSFLPGRCIVENFVLAAEMAQQAKKRKMPMIVLKLDFQKAFDSVSWDALLQILAARGFGDRWIRWISTLLHSSSSRVMINGQLGEKIISQSGLRQGDALSPYLFILVADLLQKLCIAEYNRGNLKHPLAVKGIFLCCNTRMIHCCCFKETMSKLGSSKGF